MEYRERVRGCLLGGAIGDALGGPVEFQHLSTILGDHRPGGVRTFVAWPDGTPAGTITDDTQMTLFTAEGLIRAGVRRERGLGLTVAVIHQSYDEWLDTQTRLPPSGAPDGTLLSEPWLYARRAPGHTCLDALHTARAGAPRIPQYGGLAVNDSKGCGGVMRVAPIGLLPPGQGPIDFVFDAAAQAAGYTHGHPTGQLASGAFAVIVHRLVDGATLDESLDTALELLAHRNNHQETTTALRQARHLARSSAHGSSAAGVDSRPVDAELVESLGGALVDGERVESLGGGWVAEEALAIAVYAALTNPGPGQILDALATAVTHSGDSDSTGSICGNLLGALHGEAALPDDLATTVEGRTTVLRLADALVSEFARPE